jgi:hypothetical protein
MTLQTFKIFVAVSTFSVAIPLILYIIKIRNLPRQNHAIGIYLIVSAIFDVIINVLFYAQSSTAIPANAFVISSFALIAYFYLEVIFTKRLKYVFYGSVAIYILSSILKFTTGPLDTFATDLWALQAAIIGAFGIVYIVNLHDMVVDRLLDKNLYSYQIINASLLFYFLTTLLLFVSTQYVFAHADGDTRRLFWSLHNIANTLKNIGLAIGLYYTGRRDVTTTLLEIERIGRERSGEARDPLWTNSLKR